MSETSIFYCDYCGNPEDEAPLGWTRPHCGIAITLRGRRFATVNGSTLSAAPPYPASPEEAQRWGDEQAWSMTLCDRCTKRIAALLDMKLETDDEFRARIDDLAKNVARAQVGTPPTQFPNFGTQGRMVDQFPSVPRAADNGPVPAAPVFTGPDNKLRAMVPTYVAAKPKRAKSRARSGRGQRK